MKNLKYILFAPEFWPIPGGISEYTFQLAKTFFRSGRLSFVFTNQFQKDRYEFPIKYVWSAWNQKDQGQYSVLYRKCRSYIHSCLESIYLFIKVVQIKLLYPDDTVIINSLFIDLSEKMIRHLIRFKIKYGLIIHGLDLLEWQKKSVVKLNFLLENADELILNSYTTKKLLIEIYSGEEGLSNVEVIHPPFDRKQLSISVDYSDIEHRIFSKYGVDIQSKKVISTICRLVNRKGVDLAIKSTHKILQKNPDWIYIIGGTGVEFEKLSLLIADLSLQKQVFLLGTITNEEKYQILQKSEVFMMPNHTMNKNDFEGFGISFVEAQFFNNAVIGGKSGGVVESVAHDESGFLIDFEEGDVIKSIESKLCLLIENNVLREEMGVFAHQFVLQNFEIEPLVVKLKNEITQ